MRTHVILAAAAEVNGPDLDWVTKQDDAFKVLCEAKDRAGVEELGLVDDQVRPSASENLVHCVHFAPMRALPLLGQLIRGGEDGSVGQLFCPKAALPTTGHAVIHDETRVNVAPAAVEYRPHSASAWQVGVVLAVDGSTALLHLLSPISGPRLLLVLVGEKGVVNGVIVLVSVLCD